MGAALCVLPTFSQPKLSKDNIDEVLKAMTLEEKATLVVGTSRSSKSPSVVNLIPGSAGTTQAIPRLGIPQTVLADGPAGLRIDPLRPGQERTYYCTGFPVGEVLACSWNVEAVRAVTEAMGNEVLEYGVDVILSPGMNIHRNPLCGRNFEYFSEDPVLSGKIAAAYVQGIQSQGVGTSLKHFAGNNQEVSRLSNDAIVGERALREIYLKNFEIAVRDADPWTIMSSYNRLNGPFTQESHDLLTRILRDDWGFNGMVMTDWTGPRNTVAQIMAGNDLMEPGYTEQTDELVAAVKAGKLSEEDLDICVRRVLQFIVRTPGFMSYKRSENPDLKQHAYASRTGATEGMVLLKNSGSALPVGSGKVALFGIGSYETVAGGTGSGNVNKAYTVSLKEGLEAAGFSLLEGLSSLYESYSAYQRNKSQMDAGPSVRGPLLGSYVTSELSLSSEAIEKSAKSADMAVVTICRNAGEGEDRKLAGDWNLTAEENRMINEISTAFHAERKKMIVVLNIGGVIETASWAGLADAILLAWTPGQEAGHAIADLLTGKVNPSGKLSMTFPVSYMDHPSSLNFPYDYKGKPSTDSHASYAGSGREPEKNIDYTDYAEGIWVGYRWFDRAPHTVMYPFGYGLSYTSFSYSKPSVKPGKDGGFTASITVTNTGSTAGKEAVQLYVSAPSGAMLKPLKELKAFAKTRLLAPGESQVLNFSVSDYELASFDERASRWETASGVYSVHFAASSADIRATASYKAVKTRYFSVSAHACAPAETKDSAPVM